MGIVLGALLFLGLAVAGCSEMDLYHASYYYSGYGVYGVGRMVGLALGGLIGGGICAAMGLFTKTLLRGFAVIVEAQYRTLTTEED